MGLKVGELFLDLGIEGADKTVGAITGVKSGLQSTASSGLEARVAIVGAMYALQSLFSTSNKAGSDLVNFNAQLGVSAKTLQQYQYAARQVGVSNQEVEGSFKGLQASMTDILLNGKAPSGMARLSMLVGEITPQDIKEFAEKPQLLIAKLQEYALKEDNAGLRNSVLKSFGVGDGMAAALRRNAFTPEVMARAPTYSDQEIKNLDKANAGWANLGNTIEMAVGKFNAKHGVDLIDNINKLVPKVLELADAFMKVADQLKIFEYIGKAFEGWGLIFDEINQASKDMGSGKPAKSVTGQLIESVGSIKQVGPSKSFKEETEGLVKMFQSGEYKRLWNWDQPSVLGKDGRNIAPNTSQLPSNAPAGATNVEVNQTINANHSLNDPAATAKTMKEATKQAYRQMPAQSQGN